MAGSLTRSCMTKTAYTTKQEAREAVQRIRRDGADHRPGVALQVYRCGLCEHWHVGHAKKR